MYCDAQTVILSGLAGGFLFSVAGGLAATMRKRAVCRESNRRAALHEAQVDAARFGQTLDMHIRAGQVEQPAFRHYNNPVAITSARDLRCADMARRILNSEGVSEFQRQLALSVLAPVETISPTTRMEVERVCNEHGEYPVNVLVWPSDRNPCGDAA